MNTFEEECAKCRNDFSYFAKKYLKIIHPKRGLINFPLYDFQERLVKTYNENRFVIVKKFRMGGFSTLTAMYGLWRCIFHLDQRFLFISKTDREAICFGHIVRNAINNLPEQFRPLLTYNNKHRKLFKDTNSEMRFSIPIATRGIACTHLVIDEAAFISDMENHWKAMYPTLSTGGKCFVISTVNGIGNWYQKTYTDAVEGKNNFRVFNCSYKEHPEYNNEAWVAEMRQRLGERGWMQEMECCFVGSTPTHQDILRHNIRKIVDNHRLSEKDMVNKILHEIVKGIYEE